MAEHATAPSAWNPTVLVLASFVLSPFGAGIVLAANDHRLGLKDRAPLTFYVFFFAALIGYLTLANLHAERILPLASREGWLFARAMLGWVGLLLAWVWSRPAGRRYATLRAAGLRVGPPLLPCIVALGLSVTIDGFVWQAFFHPHG
jgi:hypothetical protein